MRADNNQVIHMQVKSPQAHRVYQRNDENAADIAIELAFSRCVHGRIETRIAWDDRISAWRDMGRVEGSKAFRGVQEAVPTGSFRLDIRFIDDGEQAVCGGEAWVGPVYVGDLWILAGQSNMEGCGKLVDIEIPQAGISCFYMNEQWGMAEEPLCWLNESPDPAYWLVPEAELEQAILAARHFRTEAAGLGLPFAKELYRHTGVPIGLIPCARGATDMTWWDPALADSNDHSLYRAMLRRVRHAGGDVKGILWYQGESDAITQASSLYKSRTLNLIQSLRRDLGQPQLPFIFAQLSVFHIWQFDGVSHWNHVQQEQLDLEDMLEHAALVPTIDASLANPIHLDAPSLCKVGQRMAWQAMRLAYGHSVCEPGPRPSVFLWNEERTELSVMLTGLNGELGSVPRVYGFRVEADGAALPLMGEIGGDGRHVVLRFEQPVPVDSVLWQGAGVSPTVNVKDGKGLPLVVFGPVTV
ncbi:sialate O-acetylesterase [Paenibacillus mendelii]|uniref:Sialate O-acetylesterase n=1 Tax=Paenibacillus mendelii TaxID=206163 RepID=A0ABV6JDK9_9BACL|nr:sialate O-acetylesterase [Paenibacillus mendelii]MCQ6563544.1 sialate O-acetylesterase [Paenibacillus mendelii]